MGRSVSLAGVSGRGNNFSVFIIYFFSLEEG